MTLGDFTPGTLRYFYLRKTKTFIRRSHAQNLSNQTRMAIPDWRKHSIQNIAISDITLPRSFPFKRFSTSYWKSHYYFLYNGPFIISPTKLLLHSSCKFFPFTEDLSNYESQKSFSFLVLLSLQTCTSFRSCILFLFLLLSLYSES